MQLGLSSATHVDAVSRSHGAAAGVPQHQRWSASATHTPRLWQQQQQQQQQQQRGVFRCQPGVLRAAAPEAAETAAAVETAAAAQGEGTEYQPSYQQQQQQQHDQQQQQYDQQQQHDEYAAYQQDQQQQQYQQQYQYHQQQQEQQQYQQQEQQHMQQHDGNGGWQPQQPYQQQHQQQQRLRQQQLPQGYPQQRQQQNQQQQQQQRRPQQQQQRRHPSLLLDPQQQHHASVLANAWGESDRRAALAALVKSADNVDSLAAVWLTCRSNAGAAELAVLFNRLANVCEPKVMTVKGLNTAKVLLRELLIASEDKMSVMAGPEFVYIIASLAKLRASPDTPWINRWLAMSRNRLGRLAPQQLVMCVRALGRLDVKAIDIHSCIAFPAWMHNYTASLGPRLSELSGFELVKLMLGFSMLGYKPTWSFLNQVAQAVEPKLSGLDTVHLTCLLSSWSTLKFEPEPAVMRGVMGEVYTKLPLFDDKDLTTALTAFCSMRKMLRKDVLADFVAQVSTKLSTFSPRELAGVLVALGQLGYEPSPEWFAQATECFRGKLQGTSKASTLAQVAQGLMLTKHDPEPWLVNELINASSPKLPRMEIGDLMTLAQAISGFSYRPDPSSQAFRSWQRWFERLSYVVGRTPLMTKQAMVFLGSMCDAGMPPDHKTTDHLVLQMVTNGLSKAPVGRVAHILEVLTVAGQSAGGQLMNHYADVLKCVVTQLSAEQVATAMRTLASESFVPKSWWVVCMLASVHTRFDDFSGPAAADLIWGVAKLCKSIRLPSEKWAGDFGGRFWAAVADLSAAGSSSSTGAASAAAAGPRTEWGGRGGNGQPNRYIQQRGSPWQVQQQQQGAAAAPPTPPLTAQQLGLGLWGALTIGFKPTEEQWLQWEGAAKTLGWGLPLDAVQAAVLGYKLAGRTLPRELSARLQEEKARAQADAHDAVAAAEAAKTEAARQLGLQQQRMQQAAAAVAAFQQQRRPRQQQQQQQQQQVAAGETAAAAR